MSEAVQCAHSTHRELRTQRREMRDGAHREGRWGTEWERVFGSFGQSVRVWGVWVFRLSQMVRFAPFFFFFFFLIWISAWLGRFGRYRPMRTESARFGPRRRRFQPRRPDSGITTWHDAARTRGLRRPSRVTASDAGALAWEPRPCIPDPYPLGVGSKCFIVTYSDIAIGRIFGAEESQFESAHWRICSLGL